MHIPWAKIDHVFLDMDGTLLDLNFDNFFWQEYLPRKWGELNDLDPETARDRLMPIFRSKQGTLKWYCLDYWTEELEIDLLDLKSELDHLIKTRPFSNEFLIALSSSGKQVIMVTNAHQKLVEIKLEKTGIGKHFDLIISSHDLGSAKEEKVFWEKLSKKIDYDPVSTILIDDNLSVLRSARDYGIQNLFTIAQPDSGKPPRAISEFPVIESFENLYQGNTA